MIFILNNKYKTLNIYLQVKIFVFSNYILSQ